MVRSKALRWIGLALFLAGMAALALAFITGEAKVALVLIIPVIYGMGAVAALGILLIFGGIAVLSLSFFSNLPDQDTDGAEGERGTEKREFGGVILIGPIPIVFGSARSLKGSRLLWIAAALSLFAVVLFLILILW